MHPFCFSIILKLFINVLFIYYSFYHSTLDNFHVLRTHLLQSGYDTRGYSGHKRSPLRHSHLRHAHLHIPDHQELPRRKGHFRTRASKRLLPRRFLLLGEKFSRG